MKKEKENDSLVNKGWKRDSSKKNDSLKEKIDERLKSIERTMIYTQDMVQQNQLKRQKF